MKKQAAIFTAISLMVYLLTAALVYAAPAEVPKSGQTTVFSAGDAGSLQTGVDWPSPRFTATSSGNGTVVTDELTGLMWPQNGGTPTVGACAGGYRTWRQALDYVACLNTNNYLNHNDWQLPDLNELESLVNDSQPNMANWLNAQGFANVLAVNYWSSSTYAGYASDVWYVRMGNGYVGTYYKGGHNYVWPVRGGQVGSINLPQTGQTTAYAAGDNGSLQKGVAWPSPRFTNTDGTTPISGDVVVDQLTGLIWTQDGMTPGPAACTPGGYKIWQGALDYVACLNTNNYLGYNDWRLPNRKELRSVASYGEANVAHWLNTRGFTNVQAYYYWSSSTDADDATSA